MYGRSSVLVLHSWHRMLKRIKNLMMAPKPKSTTIVPSSLVHPDRAPGNVVVPFAEQSFTDNPEWRVFRMMAESVEGFEFLSRLRNEVSIFGSARTKSTHKYYKIARDVGYVLGKNGYSVITGGGPGIMEAANQGAHKAGGVSVGLDIELSHEQRRNKYADKAMGFHYFFNRKLMLSISSQAYIFFPGGFGTVDEMSEMLCLIQTGKIPREVPMILVGESYWKPLIRWMKKAMLDDDHYIDKDDLKLLHVVDSVEEVCALVAKTTERNLNGRNSE